ncbi:9030_t:CDS:1, partial [Dentiscutata erythropus]
NLILVKMASFKTEEPEFKNLYLRDRSLFSCQQSLPLQNNIQHQYYNNMILVNIINQLQHDLYYQPHINHRQNFHHNNFSTHQNNQPQFNDPSIEQLVNVFR